MLRLLPPAVLAAVLLAGCGPPGPQVYSTAHSRACMKAEHLRIGAPPPSDFVATTAQGGSFAITLPHNKVTLVFGTTVAQANNIDQAYRRFRSLNVGIDDVLREQGSAVMLWHQHPTDAYLGLIQGCLKK
jgi:hypothetical protein